jgi:hypothetical protein
MVTQAEQSLCVPGIAQPNPGFHPPVLWTRHGIKQQYPCSYSCASPYCGASPYSGPHVRPYPLHSRPYSFFHVRAYPRPGSRSSPGVPTVEDRPQL